MTSVVSPNIYYFDPHIEYWFRCGNSLNMKKLILHDICLSCYLFTKKFRKGTDMSHVKNLWNDIWIDLYFYCIVKKFN